MHHIHTPNGKPDPSGWRTCQKCKAKYKDKPWMTAIDIALGLSIFYLSDKLEPFMIQIIPNAYAAVILTVLAALVPIALIERAVRMLLPVYEEQKKE